MKQEIVMQLTESLIPYINNPKKHPDEQVDKIASSIKNYGFTVPIVVDGQNEIIMGHGRLMAARKLGLEEVPTIIRDDLSEGKIKALRIADNKVAESEWDMELLEIELDGIDDFTGFNDEELSPIIDNEENPYTKKVEIPQYEITGERPELSQLYEREKCDILLESINGSDLPEAEKEFLRMAAYRHLAFNYKNIAEYYAHADEELQELMEESALVLIDYEDAIKQGYVVINSVIEEMLEDEQQG